MSSVLNGGGKLVTVFQGTLQRYIEGMMLYDGNEYVGELFSSQVWLKLSRKSVNLSVCGSLSDTMHLHAPPSHFHMTCPGVKRKIMLYQSDTAPDMRCLAARHYLSPSCNCLHFESEFCPRTALLGF